MNSEKWESFLLLLNIFYWISGVNYTDLNIKIQHSGYLTQPFADFDRESINEISLEENTAFKCRVFDIGSMKYLWVVQGSLKIFLTVTFQDEYIFVTSGEYKSHRELP